MSSTKGCDIIGQVIWTLDSSHDIAVATMCECVNIDDSPKWLVEQIEYWRIAASVSPYAIDVPASLAEEQIQTVRQIMDTALLRVQSHDDSYQVEEIRNWFLLNDVPVSGGHLRYRPLPKNCVIDVLTGFIERIDGTLPELPEKMYWFLGCPDGRTTLQGRR